MDNTQDFTYSLNLRGDLIKINNASKKETYLCPVCGKTMIPHQGKKKRWHFQHKINCQCSKESYLHQVGKIKIKELFLQNKDFFLEYSTRRECNLECPLDIYPKCCKEGYKRINLKDYYNECLEEKDFKKFRPDLLLCSSEYPQRPSILIEIYVTHKATEDKINLGERLIEIKLDDFKDINIIENRKCITEQWNKINLYNFYKKKESFNPKGSEIWMSKYFWIINNGLIRDYGRCYCWERIDDLLYNGDIIFISDREIDEDILPEMISRQGIKLINYERKVLTEFQINKIRSISFF